MKFKQFSWVITISLGVLASFGLQKAGYIDWIGRVLFIFLTLMLANQFDIVFSLEEIKDKMELKV